MNDLKKTGYQIFGFFNPEVGIAQKVSYIITGIGILFIIIAIILYFTSSSSTGAIVMLVLGAIMAAAHPLMWYMSDGAF